MRGVRFAVAVGLSVLLSVSAFAGPRDSRDRNPGDRGGSIVKVIKKIIKTLGDGLNVPTP